MSTLAPSRRRKRLTLGVPLIGALVLGSLALTTAPAFAAPEPLIPGNQLPGNVVLSPTSGDLANGPTSVTIDPAAFCPDGENRVSRTFLVSATTENLVGAARRATQDTAGSGLNGQPINLTGNSASYFLGATFTQSGDYSFVVTCDATNLSNSSPIGSSRYFATTIHVDVIANTWAQVTAGEEKTATATALQQSGVTAISATLTAAVDAADATGTVTFKQGGTPIGAPVEVSGGTASLPVSDLTPSTSYTFTADYSGDATYAASTGTVSFNTLAAEDESSSGVNFTLPSVEASQPTGLSISVKPTDVTLIGATARTANQVWTATGSLGSVTVNDDRRNADGLGWTLSGSVSPFTGSGTAAGSSIPASALGWTPSGTGAGSASTDLSAPRTLATGSASGDANVTATVTAALSLVVAADKPAGNYSGTITLVLI